MLAKALDAEFTAAVRRQALLERRYGPMSEVSRRADDVAVALSQLRQALERQLLREGVGENVYYPDPAGAGREAAQAGQGVGTRLCTVRPPIAPASERRSCSDCARAHSLAGLPAPLEWRSSRSRR
jgi:hypothetical protein